VIFCVCRLPEDDTVVLKHVGMILIMNCVLWFVIYSILLREFFGSIYRTCLILCVRL